MIDPLRELGVMLPMLAAYVALLVGVVKERKLVEATVYYSPRERAEETLGWYMLAAVCMIVAVYHLFP